MVALKQIKNEEFFLGYLLDIVPLKFLSDGDWLFYAVQAVLVGGNERHIKPESITDGRNLRSCNPFGNICTDFLKPTIKSKATKENCSARMDAMFPDRDSDSKISTTIPAVVFPVAEDNAEGAVHEKFLGLVVHENWVQSLVVVLRNLQFLIVPELMQQDSFLHQEVVYEAFAVGDVIFMDLDGIGWLLETETNKNENSACLQVGASQGSKRKSASSTTRKQKESASLIARKQKEVGVFDRKEAIEVGVFDRKESAKELLAIESKFSRIHFSGTSSFSFRASKVDRKWKRQLSTAQVGGGSRGQICVREGSTRCVARTLENWQHRSSVYGECLTATVIEKLQIERAALDLWWDICKANGEQPFHDMTLELVEEAAKRYKRDKKGGLAMLLQDVLKDDGPHNLDSVLNQLKEAEAPSVDLKHIAELFPDAKSDENSLVLKKDLLTTVKLYSFKKDLDKVLSEEEKDARGRLATLLETVSKTEPAVDVQDSMSVAKLMSLLEQAGASKICLTAGGSEFGEDEDDWELMRELFLDVDTDRSGSISKEEVLAAMQRFCIKGKHAVNSLDKKELDKLIKILKTAVTVDNDEVLSPQDLPKDFPHEKKDLVPVLLLQIYRDISEGSNYQNKANDDVGIALENNRKLFEAMVNFGINTEYATAMRQLLCEGPHQLSVGGFLRVFWQLPRVRGERVQWSKTLGLEREVARLLPFGGPIDGLETIRALDENELTKLCQKVLEGLQEVVPRLVKAGVARLQAETENRASQLNSKFAMDKQSYKGSFATLDDFYKGPEALVGTPNPDVRMGIENEHTTRSNAKVEFVTPNYNLTTSPALEYEFVVNPQHGFAYPHTPKDSKKWKQPCSWKGKHGREHVDLKKLMLSDDVKSAKLQQEEVIAICLYTGPMYVLYNAVLRKFPEDLYAKLGDNHYETTIFCIISAVTKLSKISVIPPNRRLFRGLGGMVLPAAFWLADKVTGFRGGVEFGLMSATADRDIAVQYSGRDKHRGTVFEILVGRIDIGADISGFSQYPSEKEYLFSPLSCLEVSYD